MKQCCVASLLIMIMAVGHAHAGSGSTESVYELRAAVDIPATVVPAVIASAWLLAPMLEAPHCAPLCDPAQLNRFDRQVAGNYSKAWMRTSDVALGTMILGSAATALVDGGLWGGLGDLVVIMQSVLWADALGVTANLAARRPRPLVYGTTAPLSERNDPAAALSFFSGHTASAFAFASAATATVWRRHPKGALPWVIGGVGLGAASLVATGRVMGVKHFPTDVVAGALVGTAVGVMVPALHDLPVAITPTAGTASAGINLAMTW